MLLRRKKGAKYNKGLTFTLLRDDRNNKRGVVATLRDPGIVVEKLTFEMKSNNKEMKWLEWNLMIDEKSRALKMEQLENQTSSAMKRMTKRMTAMALRQSEERTLETKHIPFGSIDYVQVGAEELEEMHRGLEEPEKSLNDSPLSLYISAGEASCRIRLPDEVLAQSIALEIRERIKVETSRSSTGFSSS